jgi:putative flippase GtrA
MDIEIKNLDHKKNERVGLKKSVVKSLITSITATAVDFLVALSLANLFNFYYVLANVIGGIFGAFTSFNLGRRWVFKKREDNLILQILKFIFTHCITIIFNSSCVFLVKENFGLSFGMSKIFVAICISFTFNFLMNRYFVFNTWRRK